MDAILEDPIRPQRKFLLTCICGGSVGGDCHWSTAAEIIRAFLEHHQGPGHGEQERAA